MRLPILKRLRKSTGKFRSRINRATGNPISRKKRLKKVLTIITVAISVAAVFYFYEQISDGFFFYGFKFKAKLYKLLSFLSPDQGIVETKPQTNNPDSFFKGKRITYLVFVIAVPIAFSIISCYLNVDLQTLLKNTKVEQIQENTPTHTGPSGYPDDWPELLKVVCYGLQHIAIILGLCTIPALP